jgi:elongation factor Ts
MGISAKEVMELRQKTGAGMMDCKKALTECEGDLEKAAKILREKGIAAAQKRSDRATSNGYIGVYVHPGERLAAMVELNCETDFVARNEEFRQFADNIAMHIAAAGPIAISADDIDPEILAAEKDIYRNQALNEGKKPEFVDKIIEGRVKKFCAENCLLSQIYIRDESRKTTVEDMLKNLTSKIGENININRIARFSIGS